jgi:hypothetical protein
MTGAPVSAEARKTFAVCFAALVATSLQKEKKNTRRAVTSQCASIQGRI